MKSWINYLIVFLVMVFILTIVFSTVSALGQNFPGEQQIPQKQKQEQEPGLVPELPGPVLAPPDFTGKISYSVICYKNSRLLEVSQFFKNQFGERVIFMIDVDSSDEVVIFLGDKEDRSFTMLQQGTDVFCIIFTGKILGG
jgi:predicted PurR-regulated permease PerM